MFPVNPSVYEDDYGQMKMKFAESPFWLLQSIMQIAVSHLMLALV